MSFPKPTKHVFTFLNFDGRCEEAVHFYQHVLGAEVDVLIKMKDSQGANHRAAGDEEKIWHASFRIGDTKIMASDCRNLGQPNFQGFSLAIGVSTEAEADQCFSALAEGGTIEMPLGKTSWSPRFGVVTDCFGVNWMINLVGEI